MKTKDNIENYIDINGLLDSIKKVHILVIGDLMLDRYVFGTVERLSPEAPVPIMQLTSITETLGGAGNVLRNLCSLGAKTSFISTVGTDKEGRILARMIGKTKVHETTLIGIPNRSSTVKTRFIANGQHLLRTDIENTEPINPNIKKDILIAVKNSIKSCDALILSDYGKGVLEEQVIYKIIQNAQKHKKPVIVDPKGLNFSIYKGSTIITPNTYEASAATRLPTKTQNEVQNCGNTLINSGIAKMVLITQGSLGMTLINKNGSIHFKAENREVYDVSGAGDTVVATLAAAYATGIGPTKSAKLANIAAGIVVGKIGTAVTLPEEIIENSESKDYSNRLGKICNTKELKKHVSDWKKENKTIGFTNGCFDLIHPGHISLLKNAKLMCNKLIVGINSDKSVSQLKGNERPIQVATDRAKILAAMEFVDAVCIFDEETPINLVRLIKPKLLFKGSDYSIEQVVGKKEVESYGGKVILIDIVKGHSTSNLVGQKSDKN